MKIVMVDDCAFVGYELRRELIKRNFEVEHLFFTRSFLPRTATLKMTWALKKVNCDLVHAHFCRSAAYAAYFSGKPYLLHCHGTDIRGGIDWLKRRSIEKARKVLVSTPDLLEILPTATWLSNPVDMDRFKPLKEHNGNKVLYFPHWYEDLSNEVEKACEKLSHELTVPNAYSVPYKKMHLFLNEFDIFVDRFSIKSYSKTALEAMACGLVVIGFELPLEKAFQQFAVHSERLKRLRWQSEHVLPKHDVKAVVDQLLEIYRSLEHCRDS
jgi:hypothetical protein